MRISPVNISLMHENGSFQMYERVVHLWNSQLDVVERVLVLFCNRKVRFATTRTSGEEVCFNFFKSIYPSK